MREQKPDWEKIHQAKGKVGDEKRDSWKVGRERSIVWQKEKREEFGLTHSSTHSLG